jgi:tRNA-dihydrouridine synthase
LSDAEQALAYSTADAVMIGRGACGAPWLPGKIAAGLNGAKPVAEPEGEALLEIIKEHYDEMLSFHGQKMGVRQARKHLGWYFDRLVLSPALLELRRTALTANDPKDALAAVSSAIRDVPTRRVA